MEEGGGGERQSHVLPFYHVPQHSRREKLRYPTAAEIDLSPPPSTSTNLYNTTSTTPILMSSLSHPTFPHHHHNQTAVSLSLSSPPYGSNGDPIRMVGLSRSAAPTEPFTGYAAVLKTSRFLRPAQQMLDEICSVGGVGFGDGSEAGELGLDGHEHGDFDGDGGENGRVKSRLISMLDEVYRRYKQYVQQIQYVMASFESVAGLNHAAPYTCLVVKLMTKHFRCLKDAIAEQLRFTDKQQAPPGGHSNASSGAIEQVNVWRPQRGLPERAVAVLKTWLFEHFLHPYPTDTDKHMLAKQTGLSRNQVSNWFINARVRLWKPLVEEIHSLEMRQVHQNNTDIGITATSTQPECGKTSVEEPPPQPPPPPPPPQAPPYKRFRDEDVEEAMMMGGGLNVDVPAHRRGGGISLTLGLHQNNGVPLNVARRFGLDESTMGGGGGVGFGKDMDEQMMLRHFVG